MSDIISARPDSYLVTGFFTPDYRSLAQRFSQNLAAHSVPHHLYAVGAEEWSRAILLKPTILLKAMDEYPRRRIVLMDVDCEVRGDIGPWVESLTTDITLPARIRRGTRRHGRALFSSRVMVIAPTPPAKKLIKFWGDLCISAKAPPFGRLCDERELVGAIGMQHGATISFSSNQFAGLDSRNAPDNAKIVHHSEHANRFDGLLTQAGKIGQHVLDAVRGKSQSKHV